MIARLAPGLVLAALAVTAPVHADVETSYRGYLLSRFQLFPPDERAVLNPLLEVNELQGFFEGNLDLTLKSERWTFRSDTSALYRVAPARCRDDTKLPACLVINELYVSADVVEHVMVLVGRHRPSWGSALSYHPAEPMNPQPDPTDPAFQRLGAWTALVEVSTEHHVVTAGWFPDLGHAAIGTPNAFAPGLVGGRYAWKPEGLDIAALGFYDIEEQQPLGGVSGSAVLGSSPFEVHAEALVHRRREIKTGTLQEGTCPVRSLGIPHRQKWDYTGIVGARYDRGDGSLVNLEYMHNGDGMERNDFNAVLNTADALSDQCPDGRLEPPDASEDGRPQQLSSTFLRRNYAILSALKPSFSDEGKLANFGVNATVLVGLDDLSGVVSARAFYTLADATVVRLGGLARFGRDRTQYGILPFHGLALVDVQTLF